MTTLAGMFKRQARFLNKSVEMNVFFLLTELSKKKKSNYQSIIKIIVICSPTLNGMQNIKIEK